MMIIRRRRRMHGNRNNNIRNNYNNNISTLVTLVLIIRHKETPNCHNMTWDEWRSSVQKSNPKLCPSTKILICYLMSFKKVNSAFEVYLSVKYFSVPISIYLFPFLFLKYIPVSFWLHTHERLLNLSLPKSNTTLNP